MTYATLPHPTTHFGATMTGLFSDLMKSIAKRRAYNRTVRALSALDRAQLEDLGLHAGMIHSVSRDVTYGPHG